jgi:mRNA-degrading endonuclease toxin of MazEF toxin-antitoxin module
VQCTGFQIIIVTIENGADDRLALTSSQSNFWTEIPIRKKGRMKNDSFVLCHQIRALDRSRAMKKIATIDIKEMKRVKQVLKIMLAI